MDGKEREFLTIKQVNSAGKIERISIYLIYIAEISELGISQ